ncbi:hypothetical protein [Sphingopyxis sp.]|uniref:hypothetical protein n=1 Tax=Sphingopyxis sp. TaxID=1908224 RepID=UPI002D7E49AE|nr:hypothetical protein [Sphingopyxis sp.]
MTDVKLVRFEIPGVPDNVKDQMSKQFAAASGAEQCLTQEQADKEDVAGALSKGYGEACTWRKNRIGDGKIDVAGHLHTGHAKGRTRPRRNPRCQEDRRSRHLEGQIADGRRRYGNADAGHQHQHRPLQGLTFSET